MAETRRRTTGRKETTKRTSGRSASESSSGRRSSPNPKWIDTPEEHEDHAGQSLATRNHEVIITWAGERNARPVTVPGTGTGGATAGVLRLDFPGYGGSELEEVSWEEWLRNFDRRKVTFIFQEHLKNGNKSNFFKIVK